MKTNNHPAHGPFTTERLGHIRDVLQRKLKYSNGGNMDYIIADAVKAIDELLASRSTEPVFFIEVEGDDWIQAGRIPGSTFDFNELPDGIVNLYTAPVVPEEATPKNIEMLASARVRNVTFQWGEDERNAAADSWNACRAAMLQVGSSPVITDEWRSVLSEIVDAMYRYEMDVAGEGEAHLRHRRMMRRAEQLLGAGIQEEGHD